MCTYDLLDMYVRTYVLLIFPYTEICLTDIRTCTSEVSNVVNHRHIMYIHVVHNMLTKVRN